LATTCRAALKDGARRLEVGLIPYWAKDIKIGFSTINARAEEVDSKPAFRRRHCLVPLDSFYEWKKTVTGKQPYAIASKDRRADGHGRVMGNLALAGGRENSELYDHHHQTESLYCLFAMPQRLAARYSVSTRRT
jgi:hypothetical protein